jgi:hypothetical protein
MPSSSSCSCSPGPVSVLLGCTDCASFSCAFVSLAVSVFLVSLIALSAYFCFLCPNKERKEGGRTDEDNDNDKHE